MKKQDKEELSIENNYQNFIGRTEQLTFGSSVVLGLDVMGWVMLNVLQIVINLFQ